MPEARYSAFMTDAVLSFAFLAGARLSFNYLRGADLAGADLRNAILDEALWSDTTQWPGAMAKAIKARSEEVRPGVWQVVGSGGADAAADTPRVPV